MLPSRIRYVTNVTSQILIRWYSFAPGSGKRAVASIIGVLTKHKVVLFWYNLNCIFCCSLVILELKVVDCFENVLKFELLC